MQRTLISLAVTALLGLSAARWPRAAAKAAQVTTQLPRNAVPTTTPCR
jgi:aminopeptidase N